GAREQPQVAGWRDCFVRRLGYGIGVGEPVADSRLQERCDFVGCKAKQVEVEVDALQVDELGDEPIGIPIREPVRLVVSKAVGPDLLGCQTLGDVDGDLPESQAQSRFEAGVPHDDDAGLVNDDGLPKSKGANRGRHGSDGVVVEARVACVGLDLRERAELNLHGYTSSSAVAEADSNGGALPPRPRVPYSTLALLLCAGEFTGRSQEDHRRRFFPDFSANAFTSPRRFGGPGDL